MKTLTNEEMVAKLDELSSSVTTITRAHDTLKADNATLQKRAERAEAIAKLSADERATFDSLPVEKQADFLIADADGRKNMAKKEEPVVNTEVQKQLTDLQKQLADESAARKASDAIAKKFQDQAELASFEKKATDELPNIPGTSVEKGSLLRAIDKKEITEEVAKYLTTVLTAANTAHGTLTKSVGSDRIAEGNDFAKADSLAKKFMAEDKTSYPEALEKVCRLYPELYNNASQA